MSISSLSFSNCSADNPSVKLEHFFSIGSSDFSGTASGFCSLTLLRDSNPYSRQTLLIVYSSFGISNYGTSNCTADISDNPSVNFEHFFSIGSSGFLGTASGFCSLTLLRDSNSYSRQTLLIVYSSFGISNYGTKVGSGHGLPRLEDCLSFD